MHHKVNRETGVVYKNDLMYGIQQLGFQNIGCKQFKHLFMKILNYHAPQKKVHQSKQFPLYDKGTL